MKKERVHWEKKAANSICSSNNLMNEFERKNVFLCFAEEFYLAHHFIPQNIKKTWTQKFIYINKTNIFTAILRLSISGNLCVFPEYTQQYRIW